MRSFMMNGQQDQYPEAFTLSLEQLILAIEHFCTYAERAPWVCWHED